MSSIGAYTGVAAPLSFYNGSFSNVFTDQTITLNIEQDGVLQAFLAVVTIHDFSGVSGAVKFDIKRNGQVISTAFADMGVIQTTTSASICFYETLNFLSGADVYAGETIQLVMDIQATGGSCQFDGVVNAVVKNVAKSYVVP